MGKKLWIFISYLFHPALMPTMGVFIVLSCDPNLFFPLRTELIDIGTVFLCTYILPLFMSWVLLKMNKISSLAHPTENDRRLLLCFTEIFFLFAYFTFHNIPALGGSLKIFMLGINITIILTLVISLFTKVSFHSVGAGGLVGTVIGLIKYTRAEFLPWLMGAFAIVILVGFARYKLKAHGAFEIYVGLMIGITVQSLIFFQGA
jgi:hypothetical protein